MNKQTLNESGMDKIVVDNQRNQSKKLKSFGTLCIFVVILVISTAAFSSDTLAPATSAERHKKVGISCVGCHGDGPKEAVEMKQCFQCHISYAKVAERTKGLKPNPHDSHIVDAECSLCHLGHKPFVNYCSTCHKEMVIGRNKKQP